VVQWYYEQNKGAAEIAELARCSEWMVYNTLQLHHEFGQVTHPYSCAQCHLHVLDMQAMNFISSILDAQPVLYLDKI